MMLPTNETPGMGGDYLQEITPAEYYRDDPIPTPSVFQVEGIDYCVHDHRKGNCRHKECPHYAPHPKSTNEKRAE